MFVSVPGAARRGLITVGVSLVALSLAACSQTAEPEAEASAIPQTPVVEKTPTGVKKADQPVRKPSVAPVVKTPSEENIVPRPVEVTPFVPSAPGKRIARVNVPGPYVAVTFDDGPSASLTPQVLDIFNRHGAHATFFVQGQNANRNRSLLARAVAEGHEVGSHTWSHINMRSSSTEKIISELDRTASVIQEATGNRPMVMRPPYGAINPGLVNLVYNRYGTPAILWDVDTNDWRKPGVETVIRRAVGNAKPGSIILLHDIHPSTIAAVEGIVTGLQARGFKLVTVSQLIAMGRRAAGATAPEREAETAPAAPAATPAAPTLETVTPTASVAEQPASAPASMEQVLPGGSASIGSPLPETSSASAPEESALRPTMATPEPSLSADLFQSHE